MLLERLGMLWKRSGDALGRFGDALGTLWGRSRTLSNVLASHVEVDGYVNSFVVVLRMAKQRNH